MENPIITNHLDEWEVKKLTNTTFNLFSKKHRLIMTQRLLIALFALGCLVSSVHAQKKICITIDDLPTVSQTSLTREAKNSLTTRLLTQLTQHHVPAIGFVVGQKLLSRQQLDKNQVNLLRQWLRAGMELGNHTFAHKGYNTISAAEYQRDVAVGDSILRLLLEPYRQRLHYFRHPYLQRGNTVTKRDSLVQYLGKHLYQEAPVSIDNSDYLFSAAFEVALGRKDSVLATTIGKTYVKYMLDCVHYYEAQADSLFGRPIAHILLTHANLINSYYLGTLLASLASEGYQFVSLREALRDAAYRSQDTYVREGGISWIHRWAITQGKRGNFFKGEPDVPPTIMRLLDNK